MARQFLFLNLHTRLYDKIESFTMQCVITLQHLSNMDFHTPPHNVSATMHPNGDLDCTVSPRVNDQADNTVPMPLCPCGVSPRWAVTNRQRLLDLNSSLEFKLHRLYFISLLNGGIGNQLEALQYARHFQPFASQHQRGEPNPTFNAPSSTG